VGAEKSREREIYGGIPYAYPPQQTEQVKSWTSLLDEMKTPQSINSMIDDYYSFFIGEEKFKTLKSQYKTNVSQKLKKLNKALKQMEYKIQSDFDSDKYRLWGDLLLANLYNLKDYSKKVEVYDYENDRNLKIDLNETKTIKENANHFYKLYNKAKTSNEKLSELIDGYREKKSYFEQILYSLDRAEVIEDLMEIMPEIFEGKSQTVKNKKNIEIMKIDLEDGSRIYIGKNNKQNDYIVSKLSSDEDLWFHVHNCAGSHVLLKSQNPTDEMILRCANLAKEYSSAKNSSKVGIIYTKRKFLRKPPASNLGYVTYKNEKEIIL
jgi:predicted ribosome quality control (RQC) complex YloA/Tae2 family protein